MKNRHAIILILNSQSSIFYLPTSHLTTKKLRTDRKYLLTGAFLISFPASSSLRQPVPARHTNLHRIYVSKVPLRTYIPAHPLSAPTGQPPYKHPNGDSSQPYKDHNHRCVWDKDGKKPVYKNHRNLYSIIYCLVYATPSREPLPDPDRTQRCTACALQACRSSSGSGKNHGLQAVADA